MKVLEIDQGSEAWDKVRYMMPTASQFGRVITTKKMGYSAQSSGYIAELLAKQLGVFVPSPPSFWMEHGTEQEPNAAMCYERMLGVQTQKVGFVMLDDASAGCSPDRYVEDGLLEIKCPKPENVVAWHVGGVLPPEHIAQVQGQLWITEREWCDFFAYHEDVPPFRVRVNRDEEFIGKLAAHIVRFNEEMSQAKSRMPGGKVGLDYLMDYSGSEVVEL